MCDRRAIYLAVLAGCALVGRALAQPAGSGRPAEGTADQPRLQGTGGSKTTLRLLVGHAESVGALAFFPDGKTLASADFGGNIKLWDLETGREKRTIRGSTQAIYCLAVAPGGKTLAFGGRDHAVVLWDLEGAKVRATFAGHAKAVDFVQYVIEGRILTSADRGGEVRYWSLDDDHLMRTIRTGKINVHGVAPSPDTKWVACFGVGDQEVTLRGGLDSREIPVGRFLSHVAFSPNGRMLAACVGGSMPMAFESGEVWIWDPSRATELARITLLGEFGKPFAAEFLAFSPDGRTLAIRTSQGLLRGGIVLWDLQHGREITRFDAVSGICPLAFSPDGKTLAAFGKTGGIKLWDLASVGGSAERSPAVASSAAPAASPAEDAEILKSLIKPQEAAYRAGRFAEAESIARRILAIAERSLADNAEVMALALETVGDACAAQEHYAQAEPLYRRALAILEKNRGSQDADLVRLLKILASVCHFQGDLISAEQFYRRVIPLMEKTSGPPDPALAASVNDLGLICASRAKYQEAETLHQRAIVLWEKTAGPESPEMAKGLNNLALLYTTQGRFMDAEPLYKRALAIQEKLPATENPFLAQILSNLGMLYSHQHRHAEAERWYGQAIAIQEKLRGPADPDLNMMFYNLANVYLDSQRYAEAERLYQRVLSALETAIGPDNPALAMPINALATAYCLQSKHAEAERLYERALSLQERAYGPHHPVVAHDLHNLARLYKEQHRDAEAGSLEDRAIEILEGAAVGPAERFPAYNVRAQIRWNIGQKRQALADLHRAMDLAEEQRGRASGGERERAEYYSGFLAVFERMVDWQTGLGDLNEALAAMERGRARSLLDQMEVQGVDLLAGVEAQEAAVLRRQEAEVQARLADLDRRSRALEMRKDLSLEQLKEKTQSLQAELRKAREDFATAYAAIRNASPVYRLAVGKNRKPASLDQVREWARAQGALVLEYLLGADGGYVLIVPPRETPRLETLTVDPTRAAVLGIAPGPLTAKRLAGALNNAAGTGLLEQLRESADGAAQLPARLAALWQTLIPKAERDPLCSGKYKRLVIIPDVAIAQVPFETLLVDGPKTAKYLLDVGPPVQYAPSATILLNLAGRADAVPPAREQRALTLGNVKYDQVDPEPARAAGPLTSRSRYALARGALKPLPFTDMETDWVESVFRENGIAGVQFKGPQATEAAVRSGVSGRQFVHLACHGLVDQTHGNLFGALALTPNPQADDPADDGFLTLAEIYQLPLGGCQLTILSACDTNVGPEQRGEGVWALSRGFLVAGSRRVVASNWLVDDEAAATLISYLCSSVAQTLKDGQRPDYARALQQAKRLVRQQEKWSSPYYWGPFVLMGPN